MVKLSDAAELLLGEGDARGFLAKTLGNKPQSPGDSQVDATAMATAAATRDVEALKAAAADLAKVR
jgi:hypothetical protein